MLFARSKVLDFNIGMLDLDQDRYETNYRYWHRRQSDNLMASFCGRICNVMQNGGVSCKEVTPHQQAPRCARHHLEYKNLCTEYKTLNTRFDAIEVDETSSSIEEITRKWKLGKRVIKYRQAATFRFHNDPSYDNRGHIAYILKIEEELEELQDIINKKRAQPEAAIPNSKNPEAQSHPGTSSDEVTVRASMRDPDIPTELLDHVPADSPLHLYKEFTDQVRLLKMQELHKLIPYLDAVIISDDGVTSKVHDEDDEDCDKIYREVFCFLLRHYIAWKEDPEMLKAAAMSPDAHHFLAYASIEQLEGIVWFFRMFMEARADILQFLRKAIVDYLNQGSQEGSQKLLGAMISDEASKLRMRVEGFDILETMFSKLLAVCGFDIFCTCFNDLVLVKTLIALGRYRNRPKLSYLILEDDSFTMDQTCLLSGVVPVMIGSKRSQDEFEATDAQYRNYAVARISTKNGLAQPLIDKLSQRLARYSVSVYEGAHDHCFPSPLVAGVEKNPRIRRVETSALTSQTIAAWQVEKDLEIIRLDISKYNRETRSQSINDYFEIIMIDLLPSKPDTNRIFIEIGHVLHSLGARDLMQENFDNICKSIKSHGTSSEQPKYSLNIQPPPSETIRQRLGKFKYTGSRVRAQDIDIDWLQKQLPANNLQTAIAEIEMINNLEESKAIERLTEFTPATSSCKVLTGTDGQPDLFFEFDDHKNLSNKVLKRFNGPWRERKPDCLHEFVTKYLAEHRGSIFTTGSIPVKYCAWPVRMQGSYVFMSPEGCLFKWLLLPFDFPAASTLWESVTERRFNRRFDCVLFHKRRFVLCAKNQADAAALRCQILKATEETHIQLIIDLPQHWHQDLKAVNLLEEWKGIYPTGYEASHASPKRASRKSLTESLWSFMIGE